MKKSILLLLAVCSLSFFATAQEDCKLKKNPELRKEMRTYHDNNIYPLMKEAHSSFDNGISSTDLTALQNLRVENKQLEAEKKAVYKEMKSQVKAGKTKEEAKAAFEAKFQDLRTAKKEIRTKLRPIAENNDKLLQTTLEGLKPNREQWKTDKKAIVAKYYSPEELEACRNKWQDKKAQQKGARPQGHRPDGMGKRPEGQRPEGMKPRPEGKRPTGDRPANMERKHKTRAATKFLLWDGEMKDEFSFEDNQNDLGRMGEQPAMGLGQNYPNPASATTTVKVNLPKDSDYLTVTITDLAGKQVRQFNYEEHKQGEHSLLLEVEGLTTGNYFYTVQAKGFKETKQMSVK